MNETPYLDVLVVLSNIPLAQVSDYGGMGSEIGSRPSGLVSIAYDAYICVRRRPGRGTGLWLRDQITDVAI